MKKFVLISLIFVGFSAQAGEFCQPEAQIIAKVKSALMVAEGICSVKVAEVSFFSPNILCPLSLPGDASIAVNSALPCNEIKSISGVIILGHDGSIFLE